MSRYRLSQQADRDLEKIADYLGERSPAAAARVLEALHQTFTLLVKSPLLGTLREETSGGISVFSGQGSRQTAISSSTT